MLLPVALHISSTDLESMRNMKYYLPSDLNDLFIFTNNGRNSTKNIKVSHRWVVVGDTTPLYSRYFQYLKYVQLSAFPKC